MIPLLAFLGTASAAPALDLADHRWQHRLLLVFAPHAEHPLLQAQEARLAAHPEGLCERRLKIVRIVGEHASDGMSRGPAAPLRERFGVASDAFGWVLVGLDGAEKRRETEPVAATSLFATIDAMPLRRRELERRGD